MQNLTQALSRYYRLARRYGFKAMVYRAWAKLVTHSSLQVRATYWRLKAGQMPSDQELLQRTNGKWMNRADFLEHLCKKTAPAFLFSVGDRQAYVAILRERYQDQVEETLKAADRVVQHRFRFLGEESYFGDEINWHLDPKSGLSWRREFYEKVGRRMRPVEVLGDSKLPWELNRHQYFVALGKAYWLTGDESFAEEFTQEVLSWIRDNPERMGINWYSALEIGVRLISWGLAFHFFRDSSYFIREGAGPFLKSLYRQAKFLREHLTLDWEVRNNHILGEVAGLVFVACLFPEFREAGEWLGKGLQVFEEEVQQQTCSDGVNKEQATGYHRFVVDFLVLIVILSRRGALPASPGLEEVLEKMLNYAMHLSGMNSGVAMMGDADDGRGYVLSEGATRFWDFREALAVGAVLFGRADFKFIAQDFAEGALWLLGPEGLQAFEQMESVTPDRTSVSFSEGGIYVLRDAWTAGSDVAVFKCGSFGLGGEGFCAHAHCDQLSFVLWVGGSPVIVDSGTYTYYGPCRDHFRLTAAHNTLMVDGQEQASPRGNFSWQDVPHAECLSWGEDRVVGRLQTNAGISHQRELRHEAPGSWEVTDTLDGEGIHELSWYFHFPPSLSLHQSEIDQQVMVKEQGKPFVAIHVPPQVRAEVKSDWLSREYGRKESNPLLVGTWRGEILASGVRFLWGFRRAEDARKCPQ